jgi:hypothetical protein
LVDRLATVRRECIELEIKELVLSRDAGVSNLHKWRD